MPYLSLLLALPALIAGLQAPAPAGPAHVATRHAVTVQLMTVADFPDLLGDQRVRVPSVAVKDVLGPRLVVVWSPRVFGIDRSYQARFRYDKLLVLLPEATPLARGQVIAVTGEVRTAAAARALGLALDKEVTDRKAQKNGRWRGGNVVLVADTVETEDGVALAGRDR